VEASFGVLAACGVADRAAPFDKRSSTSDVNRSATPQAAVACARSVARRTDEIARFVQTFINSSQRIHAPRILQILDARYASRKHGRHAP